MGRTIVDNIVKAFLSCFSENLILLELKIAIVILEIFMQCPKIGNIMLALYET
jgi:hypothetical protein